MLVLGVETSCDETGLALVRDGVLVQEELASQTDMHAVFGGVVPEIASREHQRMLPILLPKLLAKAGAALPDIDAIAVARGPGLLGALLVGLSFAKGLCLATGARLIGVNHLHAHLLAPGLEAELSYPALGLLVSGGHTHLYRMDGQLEFLLLGRTLDDAAGEAFDKVAKLLNLPYPGGRYLDELAQGVTPDMRLFPRAYIQNDNLDFSFSGLKTAVAEELARRPHLALKVMPTADSLRERGVLALTGQPEELARIAASFNWAVAETLRIKAERALEREPGLRGVVVAGGVAANSFVRQAMARLASEHNLALHLPRLSLCTDNAAMIAHAGWQALREGYCHSLDLESVPRGRAVPLDWVRQVFSESAQRSVQASV
ncbi:MAG: tRNA (adenosine(37)-N6)-threonylcarbamoyltransferase complex transferase subunit TsaD [Humidesulfovibrio sp.]|uniref:tRNA (adenosine(37)-N6)-threonylcarbamoyltransferase complex transferase subunit TsaD n=1 Tax=Humidesulfovibrio sp. TaxID=2910988 RepID=UPI0027EAD693|nr:tRNA (adenosine(37)-N6)-threonylcarbamoyltransferase complex transferase subunit TsaD [Humidesulfovibrio sp.]MDQ7834545.1 tRNA (adenosine(37)-N6)-threonylcarbamoyltransferase complex transferase subunit TsaD [Humidesulfovibrio sp.]